MYDVVLIVISLLLWVAYRVPQINTEDHVAKSGGVKDGDVIDTICFVVELMLGIAVILNLSTQVSVSAAASDASISFREGMAVQLHSLATVSLNGKIGRCICFHKGRYGVMLDGSNRKVAIRPENLRVAPVVASTPPSKTIYEDLNLRSFVVGDAPYQSNDLCTYSQYSKIPPETKKFLFDELGSSRHRSFIFLVFRPRIRYHPILHTVSSSVVGFLWTVVCLFTSS